MHYSFSVLALAASLAAVSALPTPREQGIRIPIRQSKRAGIRNQIQQGTFTAEAAHYYVESLRGKYINTLDAYAANKGEEHPLARHTTAERALRKRQSEPLTDEQQGSFWQGDITIGGQTLTVDFDTGSSDLWVPSTSCKSKGCTSAAHKYNPSASKTSKEIKSSGFQIQYGDGSTASGPIYEDTVSVGGLKATSQTFSPVTQDTIQQGTGILGLGWQSISSLSAAPYFFTLMSEKVVSTGEFAFALKPTGAELYLGGVDKSQYKGEITYVPLTHESYWATTGSLNSGSTTVLSNIPMVVDSGTSLVVAPTAEVEKFYQAIGGKKCTASECTSDGSSYYEYPCSTKVAFKFGDATFDVSSTFSLGSLSSGYNGQCIGALVPMDDIPLNAAIVGDTFFQNAYAIFDATNKRVGFAQLA